MLSLEGEERGKNKVDNQEEKEVNISKKDLYFIIIQQSIPEMCI